jgi:bifunctional DNase/RNase
MVTDAQAPDELVEMRVVDVRRKPVDGDRPRKHAIVLEEVGGARKLPIWVGTFEAVSIAMHLEGIRLARPLTYAFTASVFQAAGGRLVEARINRLGEETFYALAVIQGPNGTATVDAARAMQSASR